MQTYKCPVAVSTNPDRQLSGSLIFGLNEQLTVGASLKVTIWSVLNARQHKGYQIGR